MRLNLESIENGYIVALAATEPQITRRFCFTSKEEMVGWLLRLCDKDEQEQEAWKQKLTDFAADG